MIHSKQLLDDWKSTACKLALKGVRLEKVKAVHKLLIRRNQQLKEVEALRSKRNDLSRDIGSLMKQKQTDKAEELKQQMPLIKSRLLEQEKTLEETKHKLQQSLLSLPNLPHPDAPAGKTEDESPVITTKDFPGEYYKGKTFRPHWEIAEGLQMFHQKRASRLAGSLFSLLQGPGAKLLRALIALAYKIYEKDYTEFIVPSLVNSKTFLQTGHLPKFANEAYHIEKDDLWLIPTGEVPLTALHAGEILTRLPLKYMTHTSCFRREAGAAGEHTRGMQRLHEFHKVELVRLCYPKDSIKELNELLQDALKPIKALRLPYRVKDLCTGDLTFASARTYDIEVYSPGTGGWMEVSSVGLFTDYQTRRANIRYRDQGQLIFPHALNASGLATPRVWAALLEHYEQTDGRLLVPEVLQDFMGCQYIQKS